MKKNWIAIIIAALAIAYPASSWWIGKKVEASMVANSERMLATVPYLKVIKRNHQGGVFSSSDDTTIEIAGDLFRSLNEMQKAPQENAKEESDPAAIESPPAKPMEPMKPITLRVLSHIKHGPFAGGGLALAKIDAELVFEDKVQQEISKAFAGKKPLTLSTVMNWSGGGTMDVSSPAATVSATQAAATLNWHGLKGKVDFTKDMASYRADVSSAGLEFVGGPKKEAMKIGAMQIQGDRKRLVESAFLYVGKDNGTIKEMSFSTASDPSKAFALKDISYVGDMSESGGFIDMIAKMGAKNFAIGAETYGAARYDFSVKHLHAATLEKLIKSFGEVYSGKHKTPEEIMAASMTPWKNYGPEMLKHNPEFIIDRISFTTPEGEALLKANVKIPGATAEDVANPMALIPKIDASADVALPEALVAKLAGAGKQTEEEKATAAEMMQQQLQGAEQQGYIVRADKMIKTHFEWKNGKGMINGKPLQMPGAPPRE